MDISKSNLLINAVLFKCLWLSCAFGTAKGLLWPAVIAFLALCIYQLWPSRRHPADFKVLAASLMLGILCDTVWIQSGMLEFTDARPWKEASPLWILLLWMGFALTINHCLSWLKSNWGLTALMGLIGGPMSYIAGAKIGALTFHASTLKLTIALAIAWAISMLILVKVGKTGDALD